MAAGDPDFLDGMDDLPDAPLFALPDWPDGDDPSADWSEPPQLVAEDAPEPLLESVFPEPAPPAVTPPPAKAVVLTRPATQPAAPVAPVAQVVRADDNDTSRMVLAAVHESGNEIVCRAEFAADAGRAFADVCVALSTPEGASKVSSNRCLTTDDGRLMWHLGSIPAGESLGLRVKFPSVPATRQLLSRPPAFALTFTPVPVPVLACEASGPRALPVGERSVVTLKVSNVGEHPTGPIRVRMTDADTAELLAEENLDSLPAGESTELDLPVRLDLPGVAGRQFEVTDDDTTAVTTFRTEGVVPALEAKLAHERAVLADAETDITLTVSNPSAVTALGVVAWVELPDEVRPVGRPDAHKRIEWPLADLPAGGSRTLSVRVRGYAPGLAWLRAGSTAEGDVTTTTSSSLWCEVDQRAGGSELDAVLTAMQAESPDDWARPTAEATAGERHVLFDLAGTRFAVPISQVREVIRPPAVTPLPGTPDWLVGLANVRGDVVSVVDLPKFLGLDDGANADRRGLLLAQSADGTLLVGLLVDDVASIRRLTADGPPIPAGMEADRVAPYLAGVSEHLQRLVPRLDLERLLHADELHAVTA